MKELEVEDVLEGQSMSTPVPAQNMQPKSPTSLAAPGGEPVQNMQPKGDSALSAPGGGPADEEKNS